MRGVAGQNGSDRRCGPLRAARGAGPARPAGRPAGADRPGRVPPQTLVRFSMCCRGARGRVRHGRSPAKSPPAGPRGGGPPGAAWRGGGGTQRGGHSGQTLVKFGSNTGQMPGAARRLATRRAASLAANGMTGRRPPSESPAAIRVSCRDPSLRPRSGLSAPPAGRKSVRIHYIYSERERERERKRERERERERERD